MSEPVFFDFENGEDVVIEALDLPARIFARCDRGGGLHDYRVVWWADGKRHDEWLYSYELRKGSA